MNTPDNPRKAINGDDPTQAPSLPRRARRWGKCLGQGKTRKSPTAQGRKYPDNATFTIKLTADQITLICRADQDAIKATIEAKATVRLARSNRRVGVVSKCNAHLDVSELELLIEDARTVELMARSYITAADLVFTSEGGD